MFTVEEITSEAQWRAIKGLWDELFSKSAFFSPFLTHEWFECCLQGYKNGKDLLVLVIREGVEPIGMAPLWQYQDIMRGILIWKISFITAPDSPVVDFVIKQERQQEVLQAVLRHFYGKRRKRWDVLLFDRWPEASPHYGILQGLLREQGKHFFMGPASTTPYIPIQDKWEAFLQGRSPRFRKTRRNIVNRINKLGKVEVQCFQQDTTGMVFEKILAVSERSWKQQEGIAISSREEARRFFECLTDLGGRKGWLLLWLLKMDGVPIAMEYDVSCGGKVYALRADYDEAYREYSPGAYLEYHIVNRLFEEGYLEYSTGPGLNTYKLHWTEQLRDNVTLCICNDNLRGRVIWGWERVLPFLRRVRNLTTQLAAYARYRGARRS